MYKGLSCIINNNRRPSILNYFALTAYPTVNNFANGGFHIAIKNIFTISTNHISDRFTNNNNSDLFYNRFQLASFNNISPS